MMRQPFFIYRSNKVISQCETAHLVFPGTAKKPVDSTERRHAFIDYVIDSGDNRQFDIIFSGKAHGGRKGVDALYNHAYLFYSLRR